MSVGEAGTEMRSYYGRPILKEPVWKREIPAYFFTGGIGGASAGARSGRPARAATSRSPGRALYVGAAADAVSPLLLVSDLGRPERFLNMLRVFKVTSPMSIGSWLLFVSAGASVTAAALEKLGRLKRLELAAETVSAALGAPLATYTGGLVANTAVPAWHDARRELPYVFGASAVASAGAACSLFLDPVDSAPARRLAVAGAAAELGLVQAMEHRLGRLVSEPYRLGTAGKLTHASKLCVAAGAGLLGSRGRRSRRAAVAGGALLLTGEALLRFAVWKAGAQSARDPRYTVAPQRERVAARTEVSQRTSRESRSHGRARLRALVRGAAAARARREAGAPRTPGSGSRSSPTTSTPGSTSRARARSSGARSARSRRRPRLAVGTGVTCPTIRIHPAIIAQAAATSAALMPGRFFLGVGTGENLNEHVLGDRWPGHEERLEMLEEAVEVMRELWKGGLVTHRGRHYTVDRARLYTLPDEPPPIAVAAAGPKRPSWPAASATHSSRPRPTRSSSKTFEDAGGEGKPLLRPADRLLRGGREQAVQTAFEQWPNAGLGGELGQELRAAAPLPRSVRALDARAGRREGRLRARPGRASEAIEEFEQAGFDSRLRPPGRPRPGGFFDFYEREILPELQHVT